MANNTIPNGGRNMGVRSTGNGGILNNAPAYNPASAGVNTNPHSDGPKDFRATDWSNKGANVKVDTGGFSAGRANATALAGANQGLGAGSIGKGQGAIFQSTGTNPRKGV